MDSPPWALYNQSQHVDEDVVRIAPVRKDT